jgi:signal transduction histidine kinase
MKICIFMADSEPFSMHNIPLDVIPIFILGASVLAFIYHAVLFFYHKDRFMIHYLIYLFFTGIFMYSKSGLFAAAFGQANENYMMAYLKEAIQIIYLTSYFNFIIEAIGLSKRQNLFFFRNWFVAMTILVAYAFWNAWSKYFAPLDDYSIPFISIRVFIFCITGFMLYQGFRLREIKFQLIILYGCTIYFILGIVSFITNFYDDRYNEMLVMPLEWMMVGSFIDIVFFSFAIGYRNRKEFDNLNITLLEEANKHIALQKVILEKQAELENERKRIAADMHDDLGSGLTKIAYLSRTALQSDAENNLMKIRKTASELVENMSELIWVMKEENNTLEDLATYIKSYAVEYLENNNIDFGIEIPENCEAIPVDGKARRHIFLSVKECLHNIVKHAHAKHVSMTITVDEKLKIRIHDDGVGIDTNLVVGTVGGNGLKNMKARVESMSGEFSIDNSDGTAIHFMIPIRIPN